MIKHKDFEIFYIPRKEKYCFIVEFFGVYYRKKYKDLEKLIPVVKEQIQKRIKDNEKKDILFYQKFYEKQKDLACKLAEQKETKRNRR
jgi:hypothetical protein